MVEGQELFIFAVYASTSYIQRRTLWTELSSLQQNLHGPWCFISGFNALVPMRREEGILPSVFPAMISKV